MPTAVASTKAGGYKKMRQHGRMTYMGASAQIFFLPRFVLSSFVVKSVNFDYPEKSAAVGKLRVRPFALSWWLENLR